MHRKDLELVSRILKECQCNGIAAGGALTVPSAEWMRRRVAIALSKGFNLTGEAEKLFLRGAGITIQPLPLR